MFIDAQLLFSNQQVLTASAPSTNILDFGAAARNLADGYAMSLVVVANSTAVATGTYQIDIQASTDPTFATFQTVASSVVAAARLVAGGKPVVLGLPVGVSIPEYVRLYYTIGGTSPSVTLEAFLLPISMLEKITYYLDKSPIS